MMRHGIVPGGVSWVRIIPYRKVSDLDVLLKGSLGKAARFIVPSRRDRDWWRLRAGLQDFG
jgi:hypothetical protein